MNTFEQLRETVKALERQAKPAITRLYVTPAFWRTLLCHTQLSATVQHSGIPVSVVSDLPKPWLTNVEWPPQ